MNPFRPVMNNPMVQIMQQVQQIKQNPSQLSSLLRSRGIVNDQQAKEIAQMGGNFAQVGQYLMNNGTMSQPPQEVVQQAQSVAQ